MRHQDDFLLRSCIQPFSRFSGTLFQHVCFLRPLSLVAVPIPPKQVQVHRLVFHLFLQHVHVAPHVARQLTDFLHFGKAKDSKTTLRLRLEGDEGRVNGSAHGRSDEQLNVLVVGKSLG